MGIQLDIRELTQPTGFDPVFLTGDIVRIAREAGEIVMNMRGNAKVDYKGDGSIRTTADLASSAHIVSSLYSLCPEIAAMSEETQIYPDKSLPYWAIDPLDGTKIYANGGDGFSIDIALIMNGDPVLGITCCPAHDTTFFTAKGAPSFEQVGDDVPRIIKTRQAPDPEHLVIVFDRAHADPEIYEQARLRLLEQFKLNLPRVPLEDRPMPLNLMVAKGQVDGHIKTGRDRTLAGSGGYVWDNASTQLILRNAGGGIADLYSLHAGLGLPEDPRGRQHGYMAFGDRKLRDSIFASHLR